MGHRALQRNLSTMQSVFIASKRVHHKKLSKIAGKSGSPHGAAMRRMNVSAYSGSLFASIVLSASMVFAPAQRVHAQTAPAAGSTVAVKMLHTVDSNADPAGKQYRDSVRKLVTANNGVVIAQGSADTVTLARTNRAIPRTFHPSPSTASRSRSPATPRQFPRPHNMHRRRPRAR
jgi:hypothetical protein